VKLTRLIISLFLSIALLALPLSEAAGVFAQVEPEFEIEAEAALLMETNSGKIIWEENSKKKLYPASLPRS
jgi:D-alanyl-D-alanine carboxypeptidase